MENGVSKTAMALLLLLPFRVLMGPTDAALQGAR
jgi:hypothetical protein